MHLIHLIQNTSNTKMHLQSLSSPVHYNLVNGQSRKQDIASISGMGRTGDVS
jgi:hypothetical protein